MKDSKLSDELKLKLINIPKEDVTVSWIVSLFAKKTKKKISRDDKKPKRGFEIIPPVINVNDKVHLKAGEYINKKDVDTTAGRILMNKLLIEGKIESIIPDGFINYEVTAKKMEGIFELVSNALIKKTLPLEPNVVDFLNSYEFWGLKLVGIFSPSLSMNMIKPDSEINQLKDKLLAEAGPNPSLAKMVEIEDKLVALAREKKKNDPAMSLFVSGARGKFEDNYKNTTIGLGPLKNPITNEYNFVSSNYMSGIKKEDIPSLANLVVNSGFPKAVGTQVAGYMTKQFYAVYQSIVVDEAGTDCGTKAYLNIKLTPDIIDLFYDQYIVEGNKLVLLTDENADKYVNKSVQMRSPMYCISDKICNKCAGERPELIGIKNIGLTAGRVSNTMLQKRMKNWHITKVSMNKVDPNTLLI